MPSLRDLNEQEFLKELHEKAKDQQRGAAIELLYREDHSAIERDEIALQRAYKSFPILLRRVSDLSGIDQSVLLTALPQIARNYNDMSHLRVLHILLDSFVTIDRIEKKKAEEKSG